VTVECPKCKTKNPDEVKFCGECGTSLTPPKEVVHTKTIETPAEELTTGSVFAGRYQIIEELGKGGMGQVYKATDSKINEKVALKLIKPEIAQDKKTLERFSHELKTARKISHKNVGRMYELMEDKSLHFITMEYVSGQDLKGLIRQSAPLSVSRTIKVTKQICEGLSEAHRMGVVHRDLKPSNIMIDRDGDIKIMDFGIARSLKEKGITGAGVMIGTPEYMSPEQVEAKEVDQRSDIYSLGILLYEMITGKLPFEADTPFAVGIKQKSENPQPPKELNPQIPDDLNQVILKCLEKEKSNRYQSAGEVRSGLEKIEKGLPTTDTEVTQRKPLTSKEITVSFSVKKLLVPSLVLLAIIIAALVIWSPWSSERAAPVASGKPSLAVVYFENNTGDENLDHWRKALSELLIADLTQSKYIQVLSSDRLLDILSDLEQIDARSFSSTILQEVAVRGDSTHILRGSYTKAGEQFRIDAILQDASTMEPVGSDRIEGTGEESFLSMVDELTRKVKAHFELSEEEIAGDIDLDVGQITTASPEALKYYIEGRKHLQLMNLDRSIELLEKAVSIDPEFAMAYRSLAISVGSIGYRSQRIRYMERALELSSRLSAKERLLIEGSYYYNHESTYDKAIDAYKKLLELYPDDPYGNVNLGGLYANIGDHHKAIEYAENNRKNNSISIIGYRNLADYYRQVDDYARAKEILDEAFRKFPDKAPLHIELSSQYQLEGKYDLALEEINKALALAPAVGSPVYRTCIRARARINYYKGDLAKAEEDYLLLKNLDRVQAVYIGSMGLAKLNILQGKFKGTKEIIKFFIDQSEKGGVYWPIVNIYLQFAYIDLRTGELREALKDCEKAMEYALKGDSPFRQRRALHAKGLVYLEMDSIEKAMQTAEELRALVLESPNPRSMHHSQHLAGKIELKKGNNEQAIEHFQEALRLQAGDPRERRADYIESLARAYYSSGNQDKAQKEYERITSSVSDRIDYGDIYAKSFYMLGRIYEQKGWRGKAIESYEKFLDLWKDADPGFPEVEDAQKRLDALRSE
jgi:serine/threonine protein kinase/predicted Zn-dependent protease